MCKTLSYYEKTGTCLSGIHRVLALWPIRFDEESMVKYEFQAHWYVWYSRRMSVFRGDTESSIKGASIFLDYTFFILDSYGFHFWQQDWFSLFDDLPITSSSRIEHVTILLNLLMKFPSYRYHFPKRCQNLNRAERLVEKIAWSQVTSAH